MAASADFLSDSRSWLTRYYAVRALFSVLWAALALTIGKTSLPLGIALIVAYPAWDALANYGDARRNGGLSANPTQALNAAISTIVALAVAASATLGFHAVVTVIGIWASLAGLLQLATALRRRHEARGQWPMILSGAQSALAGAFFLKRAADPALALTVADVAPYALFGAAYFAISAGVLVVRRRPI